MSRIIEKYLGKWGSRKFFCWAIGTVLFILGPIVGYSWLSAELWLGLSGIYMGSQAYVDRSIKVIEAVKKSD
jgi:hypothetical protein